MIELVLNEAHRSEALESALASCRHRLFIATAAVKLVHLPAVGGGATSILAAFEGLCERGVEVRLLHSGIPSGPFLQALKDRIPSGLVMRRCPRVHVKALIVDGRWMYVGSANLTGAGLGAKSPRRRNFEAGIITDDLALIDPLADMLDAVWTGRECAACGRREHCPEPLEEPAF